MKKPEEKSEIKAWLWESLHGLGNCDLERLLKWPEITSK